MDFSLLSDAELDEFLEKFRTRSFQKYFDPRVSKASQAAKLFEVASQNPKFRYPLPILDLIVASSYTGGRDQKYSEQQVNNLTEQDIQYLDQFLHFNASLNSLQVNRERIARIFRYLGILESTPEIPKEVTGSPTGLSEEHFNILLTGSVFEKLQENLSTEDLKALLVNQQSVRQSIQIKDPDGFILKIVNLDNLALKLIPKIAELGSGALLIHAINHKKHATIQKLLQFGVPPDFYYINAINDRRFYRGYLFLTNDFTLRTPLLDAIKIKDGEVIEMLVRAGANINGFQDQEGLVELENPLHAAINDTPRELGYYIVVNPTAETLLHHYEFKKASLDRDEVLLKSLGNKHFPSANIFYGELSLEKSQPVKYKKFSRLQIVELLLTLGADSNGAGSCPYPLMAADDLTFAKILIERGADPNRICPEQNTNSALAMAVFKKRYNVVRYLLKHGADLTQPHLINGQPLLEYANEHSSQAMINLLK